MSLYYLKDYRPERPAPTLRGRVRRKLEALGAWVMTPDGFQIVKAFLAGYFLAVVWMVLAVWQWGAK